MKLNGILGSMTRLSLCAILFGTAVLGSVGCHSTPEAVYVGFDTGLDDAKSDQDPAINQAIEDMTKDPELEVVIVGHADASGAAQMNKELSFRRAHNLRGKLIAHGIDGKRVKIASRGEGDPIASNDTPEGRAKNRQTQFFFYYPKDGDAKSQLHVQVEFRDE